MSNGSFNEHFRNHGSWNLYLCQWSPTKRKTEESDERISRVHFVEYGNVTEEDVQKSDFDWTREIYYLKIYIFRQKRIQRLFTSPVSLNRRRCTESGAIFSIMSLDSTRSVPLSLDRELDGRYLLTWSLFPFHCLLPWLIILFPSSPPLSTSHIVRTGGCPGLSSSWAINQM